MVEVVDVMFFSICLRINRNELIDILLKLCVVGVMRSADLSK